MKEDLLEIKKEIREGMKEQGNFLKEELEKMKKDLGEREAKWQRERKEMMDRIQKLEEKIKGWEAKRGREEGRLIEEGGRGGLGGKIKDIEWKMEIRERRERRRNIIVKGMEIKEGKSEEAIERILKDRDGRESEGHK